MAQSIQWHTASPLWPRALEDPGRTRFKQPALLRFATDDFIELLSATLAGDPAGMAGLVARRETWRDEAVGWLAAADFDPDEPLKLYQPPHGRFYLVAANLVCRQRGLPDRAIDTAKGESASFVVRRLVAKNGRIVPSDPSTYDEYGWVPGTGWQCADVPGLAAAGEERLPLFATTFCAGSHKRRLLAGLVPAASRDTFQAAPELSPLPDPADVDPADPLYDPRLARFQSTVQTPLLALAGDFPPGSPSPPDVTDEQARNAVIFAALDLMTLLFDELADVTQAIVNDHPGSLSGAKLALYNKLDEKLDPAGGTDAPRWSGVLREAWANADDILLGNRPTDLIVDDLSAAEIIDAIDDWTVAELGTALVAAWGTYSPPPRPADPVAAPKIDTRAGALYVVRCVYDRPAGLFPSCQQVVSEPSHVFQLAPFFDPDAPARPVRISMPVDTSIAGLRAFPKNVSFLISDQLRNQIERMQGIKLKDLDDGNLGSDPGLTLGMICSLSIPIITIVAMILLMIFVQLLNIIFWWLPFFKICFPLSLKVE